MCMSYLIESFNRGRYIHFYFIASKCVYKYFLFNLVVCQELPPLVNGRIEYVPDTIAPYLAGTEATHTCNPGFVLIGNVIRVCRNDGLFDGTPPTCERE